MLVARIHFIANKQLVGRNIVTCQHQNAMNVVRARCVRIFVRILPTIPRGCNTPGCPGWERAIDEAGDV